MITRDSIAAASNCSDCLLRLSLFNLPCLRLSDGLLRCRLLLSFRRGRLPRVLLHSRALGARHDRVARAPFDQVLPEVAFVGVALQAERTRVVGDVLALLDGERLEETRLDDVLGSGAIGTDGPTRNRRLFLSFLRLRLLFTFNINGFLAFESLFFLGRLLTTAVSLVLEE